MVMLGGRRRSAAATGVAALVLAVAGVAAAVTHDPVTKGAAADRPAADATAETTSPPTSTTVATATTTSEPMVTTTVPPTTTLRKPTTTAARATTTTVAHGTTTVAAGPACTPAQIEVKIATDQPSYAPGQAVKVTSTLRNRSSASCFYNGYGARMTFKDDAGHSYPGVSVIADSFADVPLRAGQALTHTGSWDHRACADPGCAALPAGPYYVTVSWNFAGSVYDVLTSFILS